MSEAARLSVVVTANTGDAQRGLRAVDKTFMGVGKNALKATAAIAGIGGAAAAVKKTADVLMGFESRMSDVKAVTRASGKDMARFSKLATDLGAKTGLGARNAAEGLQELAKGGVSVRQMGGALKGTLALAQAGSISVAEAATTTANALNAFNMKGSGATHVADALARAANDTTADVSDFGLALTQGGSAARLAGLSFDDTVVALEALANISVKGSDAGTSLKAALTQIAKPTTQSAETMKKLGIEFFNAQGSMKPLPAIADMLRDKLGGMTEQQRLATLTTIAGTDGMRALAGLYEAGGKKLETYSGKLAKHGDAARVAKDKNDNLQGSLRKVGAEFQSLMIEKGGGSLAPLKGLADGAAEVVRSLRTGKGDAADFVRSLSADVGPTVSKLTGVAQAVGKISVALASSHTARAGVGGALAGLAAIKVGQIVAASAAIKNLGFALSLVGTAAKGGELMALPGLLMGAVNPMVAIGVAAAAAGAGIAILATRESGAAKAARENAAAQRELKAAISNLHKSEGDAVQDKLDYRQATLNVEAAEKRLHQARMGAGGKDSLDARQAELDLAQARKASGDAYMRSLKSQGSVETNVNKTRAEANARLKTTAVELGKAQHQAELDARTGIGGKPSEGSVKRLATAQDAWSKAMTEFSRANNVASLAQVDMLRKASGAEPIYRKNAAAVQFLAGAMDKLPKSKKVEILGDSQKALAEAGNLAARLTTLGKTKTVARIIAEADSAKSQVLGFKAILKGVPLKTVAKIIGETKGQNEIDKLKAAIAGVQGKTVSVNVTTRYSTIGVPAPGKTGGGAAGHDPKPHTEQPGIDRSRRSAGTPSAVAGIFGRDYNLGGLSHGFGPVAHAAATVATTAKPKTRTVKVKTKKKGQETQYYRQNPWTGKWEWHTKAGWDKIGKPEAESPTQAPDDPGADRSGLPHNRNPSRFDGSGGPNSQVSFTPGVTPLAKQWADRASEAIAGVALASLTKGDLGDDQTAASRLVDVRTQELVLAKQSGNADAITVAADNLKAADEQLSQAAQAIKDAAETARDTQFTADDAAAVMAKVNTPDDTSDDLGALNTSLKDATKYYNEAVAAGDTAGIIKWGNAILGLRDSIDGLATAVNDNTSALLDLTKTQLEIANKTSNISAGELRSLKTWIVGITNGQIGGRVGIGRGTPNPLANVSR